MMKIDLKWTHKIYVRLKYSDWSVFNWNIYKIQYNKSTSIYIKIKKYHAK